MFGQEEGVVFQNENVGVGVDCESLLGEGECVEVVVDDDEVEVVFFVDFFLVVL